MTSDEKSAMKAACVQAAATLIVDYVICIVENNE